MRRLGIAMSAELEPNTHLEIAHVLCTDIVGYSKLPVNQQSTLLQRLNQIVRGTEQFRVAEAVGKLVRLPTGDGMALAFFTSPDAPVRCALEIAKALRGEPELPLRMGVESGPVDQVPDVNDRSNVAGTGINLAQRVMDCGDAGHILLSKRVAGDLGQYTHWQPHLHDCGQVEVKHGVQIHIVNGHARGRQRRGAAKDQARAGGEGRAGPAGSREAANARARGARPHHRPARAGIFSPASLATGGCNGSGNSRQEHRGFAL